jgi:diguanylate cyclase (GGDEF)-like protein
VIRLVKFIPGAVWLALGVSTALALLGLGAALFFRRRAVRQAGRMAEVETAALTDPRTGVLTRRGFAQAVERELARSRRYGRPFVLAYADVRGLKRVNDSEGHLAGDQLLRAVASVLGESARAHDLVGRLGGDEFALLLPEQSGQNVGSVIERIGEHLHEARDELGFHSYWGLTIGAASFPADGETFDELLAIADRRLYEKRGIELLAGA